MPKPSADAKWTSAVDDWLEASGGTKVGSTQCADRVRYAVPNAVLCPGEKCVHVADMTNRAMVGDVLGATEAQVRAGYLVGSKTMEMLGRFLRANGLQLADGWDGS